MKLCGGIALYSAGTNGETADHHVLGSPRETQPVPFTLQREEEEEEEPGSLSACFGVESRRIAAPSRSNTPCRNP